MSRRDTYLYWGIGITGLFVLLSYGKKGKNYPPSGDKYPGTTGSKVEGIGDGDVIRYMTDHAGRIIVSTTADDVTWSQPKLAPKVDADFRGMISHWKDLVTEASVDYRVPEAWIYGIMWSESNGNPNLTSPAGALGLMQVMPFHFKPDEKPFDPRTNIRRGTSLLQAAKAKAPDLIQAASYYNAGGLNGVPWTNEAWLKAGRKPSQTTRWGYAAEPNYLDRVAAANNTYLTLQQGTSIV